MHSAVVVFPGSNCDQDCAHAIQDSLQQPVSMVWHQETDISHFDAIVLPGGFSYGDYLRTGALAQFSSIIHEVKKAAADGKLILGICNGFQILLEAGLLPGALLRNNHLQFRCDLQHITVMNDQSPFTQMYKEGEMITLPIAHGEGNYYCHEQTLRSLQENKQIILTYAGENPNGSMENIAGICNRKGNVLGMMPHPERAMFDWMGSEDGARLFQSMFRFWKERVSVA